MNQKRFIKYCIFAVCFILMLSFNVKDIQADDSKTLIVYYSRTGNTKAVCESLAKEIDADIVEIKDLKNRMSKLGIIGGMFRTILGMRTKIFPEKIDMTNYSSVVLSSPIWAAKVAPALRTAIYLNGFKDKKVVMLVTCDSFYAEKYQIVIDREFIYITPTVGGEIIEVLVDKHDGWVETGFSRLTFEEIAPDDVNFSNDNDTVFLDLKKLEFPLKLRKWEEGDRFQPLGMHHKKKLSDFMIDEKIPLNLKKQALVLTSAQDIVWVVGHRIDDRYKITEQTTNVYKICNIKKND